MLFILFDKVDNYVRRCMFLIIKDFEFVKLLDIILSNRLEFAKNKKILKIILLEDYNTIQISFLVLVILTCDLL